MASLLGSRKLLGYVIIQADTNFATEGHTTGNNLIPIFFGQFIKIGSADAILQYAIHQTGIEVIARPDGAHRLQRRYFVIFGQRRSTEAYTFSPIGANKTGTIESYLTFIYLVGIGPA